jgi:hypothetical protein
MKFAFDIVSGDLIIDDFYRINELDNKLSYDENFKIFFEKNNFEKKDVVSDDDKYDSVRLSALKSGDTVHVTFTPMSQKHIEYYDEQTIDGTIFYIDHENDDALIFYDEGEYRHVKSLKRLGCGYFGDTDSYFFNISIKHK